MQTIQLTSLEAECLATLIDMYGDKHHNNVTLMGRPPKRIAEVLRDIQSRLDDTTRYYNIIGGHTGDIIGHTTSIADVLEVEPGSSFVEVTRKEWDEDLE